jgi:predicted pyridoxine 5'-phosphate oxidase superfamily flavin-nucleotide-binding protein
VTGFHEGELTVQQRAGVRGLAGRLSGMLGTPRLAADFLAERDLAVLTARDGDGALWSSPLLAPPGFLRVEGAALRIGARLPEGDPLFGLPDGQAVGLVVIDFATRRRMRVNGTLTGDLLQVDQAYGNCPQFIQERHVTPTAGRARWSDEFDADLVRRADTFFLGTTHPDRGVDSSHRGGPPGFVRVDGDELWWPDYHGNNMFNSLGNLASDDEASLLFLDFTTGETLRLSGTARVDWTAPGTPGDDDHTGRRVRFTPRRTRKSDHGPTADGVVPYRRNPVITG